MIHIFFSVHLTIYRSAKSQPSSLRLELYACSISDLSTPGSLDFANRTLRRHTSKRSRSHCSFWPDIQGKLKSDFFFQTKTKQTYLSEMDTVKNIFFLLLLDTNLYFNRIYFHTWSVIQVKLKLVWTLGLLLSLLGSDAPHWHRIRSPQSWSKSKRFSLSKSDLRT